MKAFFNSLYTLQPFQGFLADVKSFDIKNHLGCAGILSKRTPVTGNENQHQSEKSQGQSDSILDIDHMPHLPFIVLFTLLSPSVNIIMKDRSRSASELFCDKSGTCHRLTSPPLLQSSSGGNTLRKNGEFTGNRAEIGQTSVSFDPVHVYTSIPGVQRIQKPAVHGNCGSF